MVQELHCKEVSFNWLFYSIIILIFVDIFFILTIILSKIQHKESHSNLLSKTLHSTYEERKPDDGLIFHSDNGSNYTSRSFMKYLKELNITQSFSRPHIPYDNSVVESFFKYLKAEELYRTKYKSEREFKESLAKYMTFYNTERPHSIIKYWTPDKWESKYWNKNNRT